jgi:hypothetical protein
LNPSFNNAGRYQIINLTSPYRDYLDSNNEVVENNFFGSSLPNGGFFGSQVFNYDPHHLELEAQKEDDQICMLNS